MGGIKYYDPKSIIKKGCVFNFIFGGRGCGKTYGFLKYVMEENRPHIYNRRTQAELDLCVTKHVNPYTPINRDLGYNYFISTENKMNVILKEEKDGPIPMGYGTALSTFSNVRGADFSSVLDIIFDEFVPQREKRNTIKNEADAFFNFYESVNRNRELKGELPVKVYMLSNAVSIESPILSEMGLIPVLEMLIRKGQSMWTDRERGICIQIYQDAEFSEIKGETALYRATKGTRYSEHALKNRFAYDSWYHVEKKPIVEYVPICSYERIFFYRHKSNGHLYVSFIYADCPHYTEDTFSLFWRSYYPQFKEAVIGDKAFFECYAAKIKAFHLLKIN